MVQRWALWFVCVFVLATGSARTDASYTVALLAETNSGNGGADLSMHPAGNQTVAGLPAAAMVSGHGFMDLLPRLAPPQPKPFSNSGFSVGQGAKGSLSAGFPVPASSRKRKAGARSFAGVAAMIAGVSPADERNSLALLGLGLLLAAKVLRKMRHDLDSQQQY
jgi:hypothetical protein